MTDHRRPCAWCGEPAVTEVVVGYDDSGRPMWAHVCDTHRCMATDDPPPKRRRPRAPEPEPGQVSIFDLLPP